MTDRILYRTDTGVSGSVGNNTLLRLNYSINWIEFAGVLYQPENPLNVRGWYADVVHFNGFHLSNQYNLRIYLNQGETTTVQITTGTAKSINNLVNGQFVRLDEVFTFNITRESFVPADSDSDDVQIDSDVLPINTDFGVTAAVEEIVDSAYVTERVTIDAGEFGGYFIGGVSINGSGFNATQTAASTLSITAPDSSYDYYIDGVYIDARSGNFSQDLPSTTGVSRALQFLYPANGGPSNPTYTSTMSVSYTFTTGNPDEVWDD